MQRRIDFLIWQARVDNEVNRIGVDRFGLTWSEVDCQRRPFIELQARLRREATRNSIGKHGA